MATVDAFPVDSSADFAKDIYDAGDSAVEASSAESPSNKQRSSSPEEEEEEEDDARGSSVGDDGEGEGEGEENDNDDDDDEDEAFDGADAAPTTHALSEDEAGKRLQLAVRAHIHSRAGTAAGAQDADGDDSKGKGSSSPTKPRRASKTGPLRRASEARARTNFTVFRIFVFANGSKDAKKPIMLDKKRCPTLEHFLDHVTTSITPDFGVVRKLYTLKTGELVTSLDAFEEDELYIAAKGKLKVMEYEDGLKPPGSAASSSSPASAPRRRSRKSMAPQEGSDNARSRFMRQSSDLRVKTIMLLVNGDKSGTTTKFIVTKRDCPTWEMFLQRVTDRLQTLLQHGSVKLLFDLNGQEVTKLEDLKELREGGAYVCVDRLPVILPHLEVSKDGNLVKRSPSSKLPPMSQVRVRGKKAGGARGGPTRRKAAAAKELLEKKVKIIWNMLVEEMMVEAFGIALAEAEERAALLRRQAKAYVENRNGMDITRDYDHLTEKLISFVLQPPSSTEECTQLMQQFEPAVHAAAKGKLFHWESDPRMVTALLILVDQLPRSLYRDTKHMFILDDMAKDIVLRCITESDILARMDPVHRIFVCFALTHQEDLESHRLCMDLWNETVGAFAANDPIRDTASIFQNNKTIIETFGRFPDRNALLGRESTEEENVFLANGGTWPQKKKRLSIFGRR